MRNIGKYVLPLKTLHPLIPTAPKYTEKYTHKDE